MRDDEAKAVREPNHQTDEMVDGSKKDKVWMKRRVRRGRCFRSSPVLSSLSHEHKLELLQGEGGANKKEPRRRKGFSDLVKDVSVSLTKCDGLERRQQFLAGSC